MFNYYYRNASSWSLFSAPAGTVFGRRLGFARRGHPEQVGLLQALHLLVGYTP
jgi:hypothetical protein